jgi:NAD(P)H-dependent FMN reductase
MSKLRIAIIVGSTRPTRFADIPAQWMKAQADAHGAFDTEIVDLRDFPMPLFDEVASNFWAPSQNEVAVAWQKKLAEFDGYIFVVAEYNRSITGALKNALDQAYVEWNKKAFGAIAYGGTGGARALEHLRNIGVELQMAPTRSAVHIAGGDFVKVHPGFGGSGNMADIEGHLAQSATAMLDELNFWAGAAKAARG